MEVTTLDRSTTTSPSEGKKAEKHLFNIDLDIRIVKRPGKTRAARVSESDYLTCKDESTCDDSDAC